jgi:23S rRNA (adenine2503-C2)-methyltransferase
MGAVQNLSYGEIADQVVQAGRLVQPEGRAIRNVVFMGMGEPFHNEDNIYRAVELLCSPQAFNLSPRHVCVSTVGIPAAMVRFAERFPLVSLALSLHSARDCVRAQLIPLARRYRLAELREALQQVIALQGRPVMIEYLLLAGINDSDEDAVILADYLNALPVHVNLIPYNTIAGLPDLAASDRERRWAFARVLRGLGHRVTMRYSLGADIGAACGQLVRRKSSVIAGATT